MWLFLPPCQAVFLRKCPRSCRDKLVELFFFFFIFSVVILVVLLFVVLLSLLKPGNGLHLSQPVLLSLRCLFLPRLLSLAAFGWFWEHPVKGRC